MSKEKTTAETVEAQETQSATPSIQFETTLNLPLEVREEIVKKAEALKAQHKLRKIFIIIVEGEEGCDEKPFYIAYLRRPGLAHFSQYMTFGQKDVIQANKMLANNVFIAGDRELIDDDDLFLYGTMNQLSPIIESRNAELVKK